MARSGHFNHQRHVQRRDEFFARVESERQARQRETAIEEAQRQALEDFQRWARGESDPQRSWKAGSMDLIESFNRESGEQFQKGMERIYEIMEGVER